MSKRTRIRIGVLIAATFGAMVANHVFAGRANADCAMEEWRVELLSVTASDGNTSHQAYWPTQGVLTSYTGNAYIWASPMTPGVVHRFGTR